MVLLAATVLAPSAPVNEDMVLASVNNSRSHDSLRRRLQLPQAAVEVIAVDSAVRVVGKFMLRLSLGAARVCVCVCKDSGCDVASRPFGNVVAVERDCQGVEVEWVAPESWFPHRVRLPGSIDTKVRGACRHSCVVLHCVALWSVALCSVASVWFVTWHGQAVECAVEDTLRVVGKTD